MRTRPLLAALAAALLLTSGCSSEDEPSQPVTPPPVGLPSATPGDPLEPYYDQQLDWQPCDPNQCTTVEVPLDYADPAGERIELAVLRVPAADPDQRIGSLLVNPGGPGGSGIDYAAQAETAISPAVRGRYDVVGFDPRGVGASTPVDCLDDAALSELVATDGSPDDPSEVTDLQQRNAAFAAGCQDLSGALLPHVGTTDVARDLDVLRAVLGDEQLHYLGLSYGTLIGSTYAQLFPDRVGRMVLDGVVDPAQDGTQSALAQARGFEQSFTRFVEACVADDCPLGDDVDTALVAFDELMASIDAAPLPTQDDRELTQSLAVLGVALPLYLEKSQGYPVLQQALGLALEGDGSILMALADAYLSRNEDGSFDGNQNEVIYAVNCLDSVGPASVAEIEAAQVEFVAAAPRFGAYLAWGGIACAEWPVPPAPVETPLRAAGSPPILVVGTTGDPATPYDQAVSVAEQLEAGVLLTVEGDVHTAYRSAGSQCADDTIDAYLLDGTVPADGTRCT